MPGKIKVKILAGRNLPVMDRSADTTDAYVEIKFGSTTYKTDVCRKSLNPQWNSEWYKFEVEDAELQDEPLQIRLMDYDTYSANDAIGKVYINLNPLLLPGVPPPVKNLWTLEASMNSSTGSQGGSIMTGWLPVYDTMHGIRGEVNIIVKVELFLDFNKFRQSSCGVTFFYSANIPHGYHAQVIHGFVEELVVSDDPEYKWIDKIRTPRASNEARQTLFLKLSNEVQRKIGLKALDLGGNAVIGYLQNFDLEGESGIVARGIGTVVTLIKLHDFSNFLNEAQVSEELTTHSFEANKSQSDCSECESSPRLLSRRQYQSHCNNITSNNNSDNNDNSNLIFSPTLLSCKFPLYRDNVPAQAITPLKVVQSKYPLTPQMSVQSWNSACSKRNKTNLSPTSDHVTDESSVREMLSLEDMRSESQGNRFSRNLRNLRYLPQHVLAKRGSRRRVADSCDEESDIDSICSSTWSIDCSKTPKVMDVHKGFRKKRFSHRKSTGEGMAALLIRSVHSSSLPLDSVKEDRETPTPSPVNFLDESLEQNESLQSVINEKSFEEQKLIKESDNTEQSIQNNNSQTLTNVHSKMKAPDTHAIPMISSSETDTSSSDDNDEPSESSTNINYVIDDTLSLPDPSSPKIEYSSLLGNSEKTLDTLVLPNSAPQLSAEENKKEESFGLVTNKDNDTPTSSPIRYDNRRIVLGLDEIVSSEFSSDIDSDLPISAIPHDYRVRKVKKPSSLLKPLINQPAEIEVKQNTETKQSEPLVLQSPLQQTSEYLDQKDLLPLVAASLKDNVIEPENSPTNINTKILRHRFHKQLSIIQTDNDNHTASSDEEYYACKRHHRPNISKISERKFLHKLEDKEVLNSSSTDNRNKSPRLVERTDTVIYKGPKNTKETNPLDTNNTKTASNTLINPLVLNPIIASDANHLQVPSINIKDIVPKSPYPVEESKENSALNYPDDARLAEILARKYRKSCMLELIKIIDTKMLSHHHSHSDSAKRRKHLASIKRHQTPSPDPTRRKLIHHQSSRSRSPESVAGYHRHSPYPSSHSSHRMSKHSHKNHHDSCETLSDKSPHFLSPSSSETAMRHVSEELEEEVITSTAVQTLTQYKYANNYTFADSQFLEMHDLKSTPNQITKTIKNPVTSANENISTIPISSTTTISHITTNTISNIPETNITNIANTTHKMCVSHSPSIHRQQQRQSLNQEVQQQQGTSISPANNQQTKAAHSPATKHPGITLHRRSSDSDISITPKGNSLTGSDRSMGGYFKPSSGVVRTMNQEALEMLEYPFITMQQYPSGFVLHIGGLVSARSVKLLERINNLEETEGRDSWWNEIRMEIRSHARALACNVVIGYKEETTICDDVCVLSGSGTAAVINLHSMGQDQESVLITHVQGLMTAATDSEKAVGSTNAEKVQNIKNSTDTPASITQQQPHHQQQQQQTVRQQQQQQNHQNQQQQQQSQQKQPLQQQQSPAVISSSVAINHKDRPIKQRNVSESNEHESGYNYSLSGCSLCHLPYNKSSINFQVNVSKCAVCRRAKVPDVLFTTIELPEYLPTTGRGCFIQAAVCKTKKDLRGELNAKEISDCLPFLEYELHSLLLNKLRIRGMNAAFGLRIQVSIGERLVIGIAIGTAVYLTALPPPSLPQIASGTSWNNEEQLSEIQKNLLDTVKKNMDFYQLKPLPEVENGRSMSDTDESEDDLPDLDLGIGIKDVCVLEVDDVEDMDRINLLMDHRPPTDFHVVNTETIPGLEDLEIVRNLQMFTQISRAKIPSGQSLSMPSKYFSRLLQMACFKLRSMVPCALCDLQFKVDIPEQDEIQFLVVGMALGLGEPTRYNRHRKRLLSHSISKDQAKKSDDTDMIFSLDEDHIESVGDSTLNASSTPSTSNAQSTLCTAIVQKPRPRSPLRMKHTTHRHKHVPLKERYGVDITPLSYLPGGRIERYLGNLNFFFIRESNSIRENGGLSGFAHSFVIEVLAIVRAHITALGGNAMVSYFMTQCVLLNSPHKNQGQCLINVGGDVVNVSYFGDDKHSQQQTALVPISSC